MINQNNQIGTIQIKSLDKMRQKSTHKEYNYNHETDDTQDSLAELQLFRWSPESTKLMLELRFGRQEQFQERLNQRKKLWSEIADEMIRHDHYYVTGEICDLKYRNMLQTYKKNRIKDELGLQSTIVWDYYDLFKSAFKKFKEEDTLPSLHCEPICDEAGTSMNIKNESAYVDKNSTGFSLDDENPPTINARRSTRAKKRPRLFSTDLQEEQDEQSKIINVQKNNITRKEKEQVSPEQNQTPPAKLIPCVPLNDVQTLTPSWLTNSEWQECKVFGESIGLQIAQVGDLQTRALLQLKIQELCYKAKIGHLK